MKRMLVLTVLLALAAGTAQAAITTGDFRTESHLPDYSSSGPLVYEAIGTTIGAGVELDSGDYVENPSGWGGGVIHMDLDQTTNILTLDSQDAWDFQTFDAWISNITFDASEIITGVTMLSNDLTSTGIVPTIDYTNDSIHISYAVSEQYDCFYFTGETATFQITTSGLPTVPAPSAMLLGSLGAGLVGWMRRRKHA